MSVSFDQVSFLLLCLKHGAGKIDFTKVSEEYEKLYNEKLSNKAARQRLVRLQEKMDGTSKKSHKKIGNGVNKVADIDSKKRAREDIVKSEPKEKEVKMEVKGVKIEP
jgi:hypothetical protein